MQHKLHRYSTLAYHLTMSTIVQKVIYKSVTYN